MCKSATSKPSYYVFLNPSTMPTCTFSPILLCQLFILEYQNYGRTHRQFSMTSLRYRNVNAASKNAGISAVEMREKEHSECSIKLKFWALYWAKNVNLWLQIFRNWVQFFCILSATLRICTQCTAIEINLNFLKQSGFPYPMPCSVGYFYLESNSKVREFVPNAIAAASRSMSTRWR